MKLDSRFSLNVLEIEQYKSAIEENKVIESKFKYGFVFDNLESGYVSVIMDKTKDQYVSVMHWAMKEHEEYGNAMLIGSIETRIDYYGEHLGVFLVKDLVEKAKTLGEWDYIIVPQSANNGFWRKMGFIAVEELRKKSTNKATAVAYLGRHSSIDYSFSDSYMFVLKILDSS